MPVFNFLMILTLLGSGFMCFLTITRLLAYNKKYHLPENRYTKLFHFITKEQVAIIYILFTIFHATASIWFLMML